MNDYYDGKCSKCNADVKPTIKEIGACIQLTYICKCCGHMWSFDKWINQ